MKLSTHTIQTVIVFVVLFSLCLGCWFHTPIAYSDSERRELEQFPAFSLTSLLSGEFIADFEQYAVDQFPLRDRFRTVKSWVSTHIFGQLDNHDIYIEDGFASKIEYPLNASSVSFACDKFGYLYDTYLKDTGSRVYTAVVPDKNAFFAEKSGRPSMEYAAFYDQVRSEMPFSNYIDIVPLLEADNYYATDTHWRQEAIVDVAHAIAQEMGVTLEEDYTENVLDVPFYGVYCGQSALPLEPDTLRYLTNDTIDAMTAINHENGQPMPIYDLEKGHGKDPYELFLSGSLSLITINNPKAASDKELIVFRDSFGSSLTPLLAQGYKTVTVVDIRYLPSISLGNHIDFHGQDVLFLYSTLVLNNSNTLK